jgi:pimeloyl-ACP methyl ester carboxylesterase
MHFSSLGNSPQPALLILHGWGLKSDYYQDLGKLLADDFRVLIPDLPGFGKTPAPKKIYDVSAYAAAVKKLLNDEDIDEVVIVGHSFGGRIALSLAQSSPKLVKALVLTGTPGVEKFHLKRSLKRAVYWTAAKGMKIISFLPPVKRLRARFYQHRDLGTLSGVMKETFLRVIKQDLTPLLKSLRQPVLLLWGARDQMVPVYDAERMLKLIPHSYLKIFTKVGHKLPYQLPHEFAREVVQFFVTGKGSLRSGRDDKIGIET